MRSDDNDALLPRHSQEHTRKALQPEHIDAGEVGHAMKPTPAQARALIDLLQKADRADSLAAENVVLRKKVQKLESENARLRSSYNTTPKE